MGWPVRESRGRVHADHAVIICIYSALLALIGNVWGLVTPESFKARHCIRVAKPEGAPNAAPTAPLARASNR